MKRLFFIGVILTGLMFSCKDKAPDNENQLKATDTDANGDVRCIEMIYPVTYIMPDGSTITGNDGKEIKQAMKRWYEANPGSKDRPTLQYPVDVIFKGRPMTIENQGEMRRIREACKKDRKPCYEFIYPITHIMPDGSTITSNNRREMIAVREWYKEHPGVTEKPALQYPVEVKFKGEILTINNDEEMQRIKEACKKDKKPCFLMIYPVTYIMPDGSTITGNNRKEIGIAIKAWHEANPGSKERPVLQYPVEIKYKDGTVKTINNKEEMRRAKADCK